LAATHRLADDLTIRPNPDTLPLAFFARQISSVPDAATARARLAELDPAIETVVVGPADLHTDAAATASVVERGDDQLLIHVRTAAANVLRVAIPGYPGWHAWLNGVELRTLSADVAYQGIVVPAGEGDLRLAYTPRYFWIGALVSALAVLTCTAILLRAG
jgi:Bacterial membrane protein YfhO